MSLRILSIAAPPSGLFLSTVPLVWALRAAGHEVLAVNTGPASRALADSGLATVDAAPGTDVLAEFSAASKAILETPPGEPRPRRGGLGLFAEEMADGLLRIAEGFRPDLVLSTLEQGAGELLATRLGVPYVEQSVRLAWAGQDAKASEYRGIIANYLEPTRERLGVTAPRTEPAAFLDVRPASIGGRSDGQHWPMQYVPYNRGALLPEWVLAKPERPRVCVTMGSVLGTLPPDSDLQRMFVDLVRAVLTELATLDIEIVVAMGETDLGDDPLPGRVRVVGWMPLNVLLPSCAALVHHGGAGTSFTALVAGVPQLVLPQSADQPANAEAVAKRGAGLLMRPEEINPAAVRERLTRVLHEPAFGQAAAAVREEIAAMPSPAAVADRLVRLVRSGPA